MATILFFSFVWLIHSWLSYCERRERKVNKYKPERKQFFVILYTEKFSFAFKMSAPPSKPSQPSATTFNERLNEQLINCLNVQTNVIQNLAQYSQHISLQLFEIKVCIYLFDLFSFIITKVIFFSILEHCRNTFKSSISSSTTTATISFCTKSLCSVLLSKLYVSTANTGFSSTTIFSSSSGSTLRSTTIRSNTFTNYAYNND